MARATGVVQDGRVHLPDGVRLPDGVQVQVEWDEEAFPAEEPLEREPWTADEVKKEIEQARSGRWKI